MKRKSERGFTLIELVVALAITMILTLIVIMFLTRGKAHARDQQRVADLNTIAQALTQYNAQFRSYPYWEISGNKRGIFNAEAQQQCSDVYPCIYDATSGSSWRTFIDSFLVSRPAAPKNGYERQYFYNAGDDLYTPPTHYAVGTYLEGDKYTVSKTSSDPWYTTGYCMASDCKPEFPSSSSGWMYIVGS